MDYIDNRDCIVIKKYNELEFLFRIENLGMIQIQLNIG